MKSFRVLLGLCFAVTAVAVTGLVVLGAFTSWWVLFAFFGVPPLLAIISGAAMIAIGGSRSFARVCADMPCAPWPRGDIARPTPVR